MGDLMTPEHELWEQFTNDLSGPKGCDFQFPPKGSFTWDCAGGTDKAFATTLLQEMEDVDVEGSLKYFEDNGGHCDCEILFNVDNNKEV